MLNRLVALLARHGTPLVVLNVFLEQLGVPIPAVPTLVIAGSLSRDGKLSSTAIMAGSVLACVAADSIWFLLGRRLGNRVLTTLCRISLSPDSCVRDTEARFDRWGMRSLLFAKFIPGFSTIAPPLAGVTGRGTIEFLVYDTAGAFMWSGAAVAIGRLFHNVIGRVLSTLADLGYWAAVLVGCALVIVILVKWLQRYRFLRKLRLARITPKELYELIATNPIIIDVRTPSALRRDPRRIPTALVIASEQIDAHLTDLPRDREVILYCT